jgi:predicted component of type VI protein secretion system
MWRILTCVSMLFVVGCERTNTPPASKGNNDVNVEVERKTDANPGKVKVRAPGVKVDVEKKSP